MAERSVPRISLYFALLLLFLVLESVYSGTDKRDASKIKREVTMKDYLEDHKADSEVEPPPNNANPLELCILQTVETSVNVNSTSSVYTHVILVSIV